MQTEVFVSFKLEPPKIRTDDAARVVLHVNNAQNIQVANLSFELVGSGVRIVGASQRSGLSIAAGGVLHLPLTLRGATGNAAIAISGISFRAGGRTIRLSDVSLSVEFLAAGDAPRPARPAGLVAPMPKQPPALATYWQQALWWTQNPPSATPGRGARVFVSFAGDLERKTRDYGVDWVKALENALKRPLADLSRKLHTSGRKSEEVSAFIYSSREHGLKPGIDALSTLVNIMHTAPAAVLLLSHDYPAMDPTWCFEAPYLMWRHMTDGMPLFLVRATAMGENLLRYPSTEGEREVDLRGWTCDRFGHPNILGHLDSMSLQQLKELGHLDDALLRLNGVASALAEALAERLQ